MLSKKFPLVFQEPELTPFVWVFSLVGWRAVGFAYCAGLRILVMTIPAMFALVLGQQSGNRKIVTVT